MNFPKGLAERDVLHIGPASQPLTNSHISSTIPTVDGAVGTHAILVHIESCDY